ncbi:cyclic nucleotide-gated cation channel alpha-3-like isoform X2 [Pseudorasbora parva]
MVIGFLAFGISMSSMSSVISNMMAQRGKFYHRMEAVHHYMKHMELPEEIQMWVHDYYYYLWYHHKGRVIQGLLDDLPFVLHSDVSSYCHKSLINNAKLFRATEHGFKKALSLKLKTYMYSPGEILVKAGEVNQNLYYVKHGILQVLNENSGDEIATLLPRTLFGEVHLLYKIPRNVTMRTLTLCEITVLKHKDLLSLFADYPETRVKIVTVAKTRLRNSKYPLLDACPNGVAFIPQNVVFDKDQSIKLHTRDQRIFNASLGYGSNRSVYRTFHPDSAFVKGWKAVYFWCIIISIFLKTWVFFFTKTPDLQGLFTEGWAAHYLAVDGLTNIFAAFDILVNLRTGVFTEDGLVTDLAVIFQVYRRSWDLFYDALAVLPLEFIYFAFGGTEHLRILGLVKLVLIHKVYKHFCRNERDIYKNVYEQRMVKCLFILIFYVHFCSGLLYVVACDEEMCNEESWAWNAGLKPDQSKFDHYIVVAYWTITTMTSVGYGDNVPSSLIEQLLAAVIGLIGLLIFNYIVSQMSATISGENANRVDFQSLFAEMRHFMEQHDLKASLQIRVLNYMSLLWSKYQGEAYPGGRFLMHDLPDELKQNVVMAERGELLSQIPFFSEAGESFLQDLALTSVLYFFPKGEIIQYSNTFSKELFCILKGTCQCLNDELSEVVGQYQKGMYFGEISFLFGKRTTLTVQALTCCEIVVINFDMVEVLLEKHPLFKRQIEEFRGNPKSCEKLIRTAAKVMKKKHCDDQESDTVQTQKIPFTFQGRRYSKKSKCYVEDFGNIPMYAGSEEETVQNKQFRHRPNTLMEHIIYFFTFSCPSSFLMRSSILPSSAFYVKWELFRSLLAVAVSIASSLLFSFLHFRMELWIVCYILGLFCWVDIYLRMHVAFYVGNDLKVDTLETACNYIKTGFFADFITCFPWELLGWIVISPFSENGFYASYEALHLYAYFRIPHIFQLYRVPFVFSFLQADLAAATNIICFWKLALYFFLFLHLSTCIIFASACPLLDIYGNTSNYLLPLIKHNCKRLSWVTHLDTTFDMDFKAITFEDTYLMALYYVTATVCSVGFGDIHPYVTSSKVLMVFVMIAATLFCGFISGTVTAMLANTDAMRAAYTERTESMKLFLKSHEITGTIYERVIGFYTFQWIHTKGFDQQKLYEYLPSSLVSDISTVLYADFIAKMFGLDIPRKAEACRLSNREITDVAKLNGAFFEMILSKNSLEQLEMDGCFIRLLSKSISQCLYRAGDVIYKKDDIGSEMYFIQRGEVAVLSNDESAVRFKIKPGLYFGERSLLFEEPRPATLRAATNCEFYVLTKESLDEILKHYPIIRKQVLRTVDTINNQLHNEDHPTERERSSAETFHRDGCAQIYQDKMDKKEHKAKLRLRPLSIRLCSSISSTLIRFFLKIFNSIKSAHNKTIVPENSFRVLYQYTSCLLITILFWAITFMPAVFDVNWYLFLLTQVVEFLQICEIFLKFHFSYYDESGSNVSDYRATSYNYMKRKMGYVFDMVCSFPYGLLIMHHMKKEPANFLPMIIYVRIGHLPRIISLIVFMWKEEQSITSNVLYIRMIKYFVHSILFVHCAAVLCISFVESHGIMSWIAKTEIYAFTEMYRYATYWIIQIYTTTGYGDIKATNLGEVIACVMLMILSRIQVVYKIGLLIATQTNKRTRQEAFEEKLQTIQGYMKHERIPSALQKRVTQFYSYRWNRNRGTSTDFLFKSIPRSLKVEVVSRICTRHFKKHQLFSHFTEPVLRELSTRILFQCFPAGEFIYRRGDICTGIYLIIIGKVNLCLDSRGKIASQRLSTGAAFGEHALLQCTHPNTAIAANYVDIAIISKKSLNSLDVLYPAAMRILLKKASDILHP